LVKVGAAFLVFAVFMVWVYAHRPGLNPLRDGRLGPEWQCDPGSPAHVCVKDVRIVRPNSVTPKP
jgi:hypothetical protein